MKNSITSIHKTIYDLESYNYVNEAISPTERHSEYERIYCESESLLNLEIPANFKSHKLVIWILIYIKTNNYRMLHHTQSITKSSFKENQTK